MFRLRRITRYVLSELLTPTLLALFLYTFVLLMNHFFLVAEKSLARNLDWGLSVQLFVIGIPRLLVLSTPMAVLLGTLIAVGRLSADQEWIALQGAGQGPWTLLKPVLFFSTCWFLIIGAVYAIVVPSTNYQIRSLQGEIYRHGSLATDLKPRGFYTQIPGVVLFVDEIRPGADQRMEGVLLVQSDRERGSTELLLARHGDLYPATDGSGALVLTLYDGVWHQFDSSQPSTYRLLAADEDGGGFRVIRKRLEPADFLQALLDPPRFSVDDLRLPELFEEYRQARAEARLAGLPPVPDAQQPPPDPVVAEYRVRAATSELHRRLALPMTCVFFAILAVPLGINQARSGKGAGFAMSLVVILIYRVAFGLAMGWVRSGHIPPALGPWAGNIVLVPWIIWAYTSMRWSERLSIVQRLTDGLQRAASWFRRSPAAQDTDASSEPTAASWAGRRPALVSRLDAYIGRHFLRVLLFAVASAYMIYTLVEMQGVIESALRTEASWELILRYFRYFAPGVLYIVLPIACLVAAVVALTLLARSGELVAIVSQGLSLRRVTVPVLFLTLLGCGGLFLVQDRVAPVTNRKALEIKDRLEGRPARTYGTRAGGTWSFGPGGQRLYHFQTYDANEEVFQGLSVFSLDREGPRVVDHRFAKRARWTGTTWELEESWYRTFPREAAAVFEEHAELIEVALDAPELFAGQRFSFGSPTSAAQQMSLGELGDEISDLRDRGYDTTRLDVAWHARIAQSMAPLVMVLLGLPFAFRVGRRGSLYAIGVALLLVLVYWAAFAIFNALGLETRVVPLIAAWGPNVLFSLLGTSMLLWVRT